MLQFLIKLLVNWLYLQNTSFNFGTWQVLILDSASSLLFSQSGVKLWLCQFLRLWWMEKESRPNPTQRNELLSSRQKLCQSHRSCSTGSASAWTGWLGCKIWKPSLVHLMWATAAVRTKVCFNTRKYCINTYHITSLYFLEEQLG